jgi:nucleoid-associated protein YgaU
MTNGIRNALLFGGGALVAALAVAYGTGAFSPAPQGNVAETASPTENSMTAKEGRVPAVPGKPAQEPSASGNPEATESAAPQTAKDGGTSGSEAASGANETAAASVPAKNAGGASDPAKPADVTAPSFDIVRAEGNGSIVVAGRSAPGAKVEILSGSNVLGAATAGGEGDFAIVLDDPLKPGDYQLVLRSTTPANVVAMSKETAVVSIPEHESGQVLALVESPGQPSKLITVPQPEKTAAAAPPPAAPGAAQSGTSQGAATTVPSPATPKDAGGAPATATAGAPQQGATGAPSPLGTTPAPAGSGPAMASAGDASPQQAGGQAQPSSATAQADAGQQPAAAQSQISVEAVEIEGNKIFVAGIADPGSTVRVYANDAVLGEAKTSPVGRFLVESIHELAVGDYIIRADMLAADGLKVAARAAVPFTRGPGESVAAVASGEAGSGTAGKGGAGAPAGSATGAASAGIAADAGSAGTAAPGNAANAMAAASDKPSAGAGAGTGADNAVPGSGAPQIVASNGQGSTVLPPLDNDISRQPPTVVSPKLQGTSGAVIIRRGDTLWQISRRVYGHGVRYSTIYLANQDQIEDPDLIWPGQIFAVPQQTEKGETANMKAIASQATEMPKKAVE